MSDSLFVNVGTRDHDKIMYHGSYPADEVLRLANIFPGLGCQVAILISQQTAADAEYRANPAGTHNAARRVARRLLRVLEKMGCRSEGETDVPVPADTIREDREREFTATTGHVPPVGDLP